MASSGGGLSVESSSPSLLRAPSRTVTLGRIQPQAPTYRTVFCNDRDANLPVRFKVTTPFLKLLAFFYVISQIYVHLSFENLFFLLCFSQFMILLLTNVAG